MLEFLLSVSLFCRRQKICILTFIFLRSICHYLLALSPGASFDCGTNEIVKKRDNTIGTFVHTNNFIVISIFIGGVVCGIVWDWVCMSAICFSFSRFSNSLVPTHFTHKLYYAYGISFFFSFAAFIFILFMRFCVVWYFWFVGRLIFLRFCWWWPTNDVVSHVDEQKDGFALRYTPDYLLVFLCSTFFVFFVVYFSCGFVFLVSVAFWLDYFYTFTVIWNWFRFVYIRYIVWCSFLSFFIEFLLCEFIFLVVDVFCWWLAHKPNMSQLYIYFKDRSFSFRYTYMCWHRWWFSGEFSSFNCCSVGATVCECESLRSKKNISLCE